MTEAEKALAERTEGPGADGEQSWMALDLARQLYWKSKVCVCVSAATTQ